MYPSIVILDGLFALPGFGVTCVISGGTYEMLTCDVSADCCPSTVTRTFSAAPRPGLEVHCTSECASCERVALIPWVLHVSLSAGSTLKDEPEGPKLRPMIDTCTWVGERVGE